MKILFICLSTLKFNVLTPLREPLGGTESAIAYLSVALVKLGHNVTLMCNGIEEMIDGVVHTPVSEDITDLDPDIVIVASAPQACPAIKKIVPRAKIVLWNHMRPDQPAVLPLFQKEVLAGIDRIVYVSESQRASFTTLANRTDTGGDVINNAVSPAFENLFSSAEEILAAKLCRGAYISTPYRGLSILSQIKELPIDIFSSMKVYQGDDSEYAGMYEQLRTNDCLELHGSVSQAALASRLKQDSFLVYPSVFTECHSIAILEAMAAGLKVVTTDAAHLQTEFVDALPSKDATLEAYTALLKKNINYFRSSPEVWADKMWQQVQYVNREFTWAKKSAEWNNYLHNLLDTPT